MTDIQWLVPQIGRSYDDYISINSGGGLFISKGLRQKTGIVDAQNLLRPVKARIGVRGNDLIVDIVPEDFNNGIGLFHLNSQTGMSFNAAKYTMMEEGNRYHFHMEVSPEEFPRIVIDMSNGYQIRSNMLPSR